MEKVLAELIALAVEGNVEQRCASLIVMGALKLQNSELGKTVSAMMDEPNPVLKDYALRYFEQAQGKQSVAIFAKHLDDPDKEKFGSSHSAGTVQCVFLDGHVAGLHPDMHLDVLKALSTIGGGEVTAEGDGG